MSFNDGFEPYEGELVFEQEGDFARGYDEDEDEFEVQEYGEEGGDNEIENDVFMDNDFRVEYDGFEQMGGEEFGSSYADRERIAGPISSVAQIKGLINVFGGALGKKDEKISFENLSDEDIFKLLLNNVIYANKLNNYYPTTNFTSLMEELFLMLNRVPNLKYKNPAALFISYLCVARSTGEIIKSKLEHWTQAINVLNIYCTDVIRYSKLWKQIYNKN